MDKLIKDVRESFISIEERQELIFHHSAFVQCALPVGALPDGNKRYQVNNGHASLVVKAGELVDPINTKRWEQRQVPYGGKARLILAYLNDNAIRTGNTEFHIGKNPSQAMAMMRIPEGGKNRLEFIEQLKNLLVCDLMIGVWGDKGASQQQMKIAKNITIWADHNFNKNKFWDTKIIVSDDYMKLLENNRVPLDIEALASLQRNPRAMDVYMFLSYRLWKLKSPTLIKYDELHKLFGQGIKNLRDFKIHFKKAVEAAYGIYQTARITPNEEGLLMYPSPSPIKKNQIYISNVDK